MNNVPVDASSPLEESAHDRRNVLKVLGGAAVVGVAGMVARPEKAEAALVTVVITNLLNNLSVDVDVKNNNVAVQVCAVIEALNVGPLLGPGTSLTCEIQQKGKTS